MPYMLYNQGFIDIRDLDTSFFFTVSILDTVHCIRNTCQMPNVTPTLIPKHKYKANFLFFFINFSLLPWFNYIPHLYRLHFLF